jgi:hypothetical protein
MPHALYLSLLLVNLAASAAEPPSFKDLPLIAEIVGDFQKHTGVDVQIDSFDNLVISSHLRAYVVHPASMTGFLPNIVVESHPGVGGFKIVIYGEQGWESAKGYQVVMRCIDPNAMEGLASPYLYWRNIHSFFYIKSPAFTMHIEYESASGGASAEATKCLGELKDLLDRHGLMPTWDARVMGPEPGDEIVLPH